MNRLASVRHWINRDNGRIYQAGNRALGTLEAFGLLFSGTGPLAWFLLPKIGFSSNWAVAVGLAGIVLLALHVWRTRRSMGA